jgi:type I site-specific restriction endonuclease
MSDRVTVQAWAKSKSDAHHRALKALTGEQVDRLRTAIGKRARAEEMVEKWKKDVEAQDATIDGFEAILNRVVEAATPTAS